MGTDVSQPKDTQSLGFDPNLSRKLYETLVAFPWCLMTSEVEAASNQVTITLPRCNKRC